MLLSRASHITMPDETPPTEYTLNASDQYADVVSLYNTLALLTREINTHIAALEGMKDQMLRTMSTILHTESQKAAFSAQSPHFSRLTRALACNRAHILVLEQWEGDFRAAWKARKKESVLRRQVWLEGKSDEVQKLHEGYQMEVVGRQDRSCRARRMGVKRWMLGKKGKNWVGRTELGMGSCEWRWSREGRTVGRTGGWRHVGVSARICT
jgi:hypothetical protein